MSQPTIYYSLHCKPEEAPKAIQQFVELLNEQAPVKVPTSLVGVSHDSTGVGLIFSLVFPQRRSNLAYSLGAVENVLRVSKILHKYFPAFHAPPLENEELTAKVLLESPELKQFIEKSENSNSEKTKEKYALQENTLEIVGGKNA